MRRRRLPRPNGPRLGRRAERHAGRARVPPERIELGAVVLRRLTLDDANALSEAATTSLDHLAPWMPWATPAGISVETQRDRLLRAEGTWSARGGYEYGIFFRADDALVGGCGLHKRIGPRALEIGYWVHVDYIRLGIATASAAALTTAGFEVRGIERIEIRCDEANRASAAVPAKLGYQLTGTIEHTPEAPGEVGRRLVWAIHRREWLARTQGEGSEP
jgi:RimJ/RimL family protein N-acetyltransferase